MKQKRKKERKKERKNKKNSTFVTAHLCLAVFKGGWGKYISISDHKSPEEGGWLLKYAFSVFVAELYGFCLSVACIAPLYQPYIEGLLNLWYMRTKK